MSYLVTIYNHKTNTEHLLNKGSYRDMCEYIESWMADYLHDKHGMKNVGIKEHKGKLTKEEWNQGIRCFITKGNQTNKYTIKEKKKVIGWLYNSYPTEKLLDVYITKNEERIERSCSRITLMINMDDYDEVVNEINSCFGNIKKDNNYE